MRTLVQVLDRQVERSSTSVPAGRTLRERTECVALGRSTHSDTPQCGALGAVNQLENYGRVDPGAGVPCGALVSVGEGGRREVPKRSSAVSHSGRMACEDEGKSTAECTDDVQKVSLELQTTLILQSVRSTTEIICCL